MPCDAFGRYWPLKIFFLINHLIVPWIPPQCDFQWLVAKKDNLAATADSSKWWPRFRKFLVSLTSSLSICEIMLQHSQDFQIIFSANSFQTKATSWFTLSDSEISDSEIKHEEWLNKRLFTLLLITTRCKVHCYVFQWKPWILPCTIKT